VLEELAYQFTCEGKEIFSSDELYDKIEAYLQEGKSTVFRDTNTDELMTELSEEDGIIQNLSSKDGRYLFVHRTFQEYFTACYLKRAIQKNQSDGIALAREHFWEYDWHETLSLLAGLMQEPIPLLQAIADEKDDIFSTLLLLAGRCIAECQENSHLLIAEIINRIYKFWQSYPHAGFIESVVVAIGQANSQMLERLQKALNHSDRNVRSQAAEALGKIGNAQAVKPLIAALNDSDSFVTRSVAEALGEMGNPQALNALIKALKHEVWNVRGQVVEALGKTGNPQVVEVLIKTLNDEDDFVREQAVRALRKIDNLQAIEGLIQALNHEGWGVRMLAAMALGKINSPQVIEALITALNDENRYVKITVAKALAEIRNPQAEATNEIGNSQAVEVFIEALNHEDWSIREWAVRALVKIADPQVVEALIKALNDKHPYVRGQAVESLAKIGTSEALAQLIQIPQIEIYNPGIFRLARTLAVRFSQEKLPFIPVYPELVAHKQ
jgi:HEAT repeat protein